MMEVLRCEDERWMNAMKAAFAKPIDWEKYYRKRDQPKKRRTNVRPVDQEKLSKEQAEQYNLFPKRSTDDKMSTEFAAATLNDTEYLTSK
jgi:hypothetical protein